jgi:hypothetical protein
MSLMKKLLLFTLILFCGLSGFGQSKQSKIAKEKPNITQNKTEAVVSVLSPLSAEEYIVYMAVLGKNREMFVVMDKSDMDKQSKNIEGNSVRAFLKELTSETIEDFQTKNKENARFKKKFPTNANYTLMTIDELKESFNYKWDGDLDWEGFYKKYPKSGGIFTFSRVGFSKDGQQALLFVTNWCRTLCGTGEYYLLKKENGEWKVVNKHMIWIS